LKNRRGEIPAPFSVKKHKKYKKAIDKAFFWCYNKTYFSNALMELFLFRSAFRETADGASR
jgi:hypothetical protein